MSDANVNTNARDLARLTAVQGALHKVQEQAAAFEELGEQLSLSVHMLEAEVAGLARELRSRPAAHADALPSELAPPSELAAPFAAAAPGVAQDVAIDGDAEPAGRERSADVEGARLVALNMALAGDPREATARYIAEHFDIPDRARLLDDVYAAAAE